MRHVRNLQKLKVICKNLPLMCLTPLARRPRGCIVLRLRWSRCVKQPECTCEGNDMPSKFGDVHGGPPPAGILAKSTKNPEMLSSELNTIAGPARGQSPVARACVLDDEPREPFKLLLLQLWAFIR